MSYEPHNRDSDSAGNGAGSHRVLGMLQGGAIVYELTDHITRIGRSSGSDIVIRDSKSVSGNHAELHIDDTGDAAVVDLNSLNGCFVNDVRVQAGSLELHAGDVLRFGYDSESYRYWPPQPQTERADEGGAATATAAAADAATATALSEWRQQRRLSLDAVPAGVQSEHQQLRGGGNAPATAAHVSGGVSAGNNRGGNLSSRDAAGYRPPSTTGDSRETGSRSLSVDKAARHREMRGGGVADALFSGGEYGQPDARSPSPQQQMQQRRSGSVNYLTGGGASPPTRPRLAPSAVRRLALIANPATTTAAAATTTSEGGSLGVGVADADRPGSRARGGRGGIASPSSVVQHPRRFTTSGAGAELPPFSQSPSHSISGGGGRGQRRSATNENHEGSGAAADTMGVHTAAAFAEKPWRNGVARRPDAYDVPVTVLFPTAAPLHSPSQQQQQQQQGQSSGTRVSSPPPRSHVVPSSRIDGLGDADDFGYPPEQTQQQQQEQRRRQEWQQQFMTVDGGAATGTPLPSSPDGGYDDVGAYANEQQQQQQQRYPPGGEQRPLYNEEVYRDVNDNNNTDYSAAAASNPIYNATETTESGSEQLQQLRRPQGRQAEGAHKPLFASPAPSSFPLTSPATELGAINIDDYEGTADDADVVDGSSGAGDFARGSDERGEAEGDRLGVGWGGVGVDGSVVFICDRTSCHASCIFCWPSHL